jgi:hypothetical protein
VVEGYSDPFRRLTAKLKRTMRSLMSWSDKKVGCETAADDNAGGGVEAGYCHGITIAFS